MRVEPLSLRRSRALARALLLLRHLELRRRNAVGHFHAGRPVPNAMVLTGSNQAVLVLHASQPTTRLRMHYKTRSGDGFHLLSLRVSPTWLTLWLGALPPRG